LNVYCLQRCRATAHLQAQANRRALVLAEDRVTRQEHALPIAVAGLRAEIAAADALVFCTPEYAGTLPGSLKNLLDWTVGGTEISAKPVVWINVAAPGRGHGAIATLETVLGYVSADVLQAGRVELPIARDLVGADGIVVEPTVRDGLAGVWTTLAQHLQAPQRTA